MYPEPDVGFWVALKVTDIGFCITVADVPVIETSNILVLPVLVLLTVDVLAKFQIVPLPAILTEPPFAVPVP